MLLIGDIGRPGCHPEGVKKNEENSFLFFNFDIKKNILELMLDRPKAEALPTPLSIVWPADDHQAVRAPM